MRARDFHTWGELIGQENLAIPLARALAVAVTKFPFTTLLEVRRRDAIEGLVVEFQVELPQHSPVPIRGREIVAIVLGPDEDDPPKIYALREDFPDTPHQNLTPPCEPKELCLFEEQYTEIKFRLTPQMLLQRIADWLTRAAVDGLHLSDQPLEPLLLSPGRIIFDPDLFKSDPERPPIIVVDGLSEEPMLLRTLPEGVNPTKPAANLRYLMLPITAPPWRSRCLDHLPQNLEQLAQLLRKLQVDLENKIRIFIIALQENGTLGGFKEHKLIVILQLPKTRVEGDPVESIEWWAFLILASIEDLAVKLGIMAKAAGALGRILGLPEAKALNEVPVVALRPTFSLSKPFARKLSRLPDYDPKIVAIGAGSLGSQVILNLARQGFGTWAIVDREQLLSHNFARHALSRHYEGWNKAEAVATEIQVLLNDKHASRAFPFDILKHKDAPDELRTALQDCEIILDLSASHAVARTLAHLDYPAGRVCAFLSPNGRYLIVLSEGQERSVRLDDLEVQAATAIAENPQFHRVYTDPTGSVPYAGSCRDASIQLANDVVALHAAVASQFIKANALSVEPNMTIWELSDTFLSLTRHSVPVHHVTVTKANDWTIRTSDHVGNLVRCNRRWRLPNETGGVLLGKIDLECRSIYISTALPSPPDSVEWPTVYIRGVHGLREKVETINRVTGGDLSYIGEWHTHPVGYSSDPSENDHKAHRWLVSEMGIEGLPGLIAIQGDSVAPYFLIDLDA